MLSTMSLPRGQPSPLSLQSEGGFHISLLLRGMRTFFGLLWPCRISILTCWLSGDFLIMVWSCRRLLREPLWNVCLSSWCILVLGILWSLVSARLAVQGHVLGQLQLLLLRLRQKGALVIQ